MNMIGLIDAYSAGGAILALWLIVRFPNVVPKGMGVSMILIAVGYVALSVAQTYAGEVAHAATAAVALLLVVLPAYVAMFWACGCFIRACVSALAMRH